MPPESIISEFFNESQSYSQLLLLIEILLVVAVLAFIFKMLHDSYEGKIIDIIEHWDPRRYLEDKIITEHARIAIIKMPDKRTRRIYVGKEFNIGDDIVKGKWSFLPVKK